MDSKFNVVYTGQLSEGVTEDEFVAKFCGKFGVSESKARQIAASTSDVTIKKNLDGSKAKQYLNALEGCGMIARLDEIAVEPELGGTLSMVPMDEDKESEPADIPPEAANHAKAVCPKCGSEQVEGDECKACGIFISKYLTMQQNSPVANEPDENKTETAVNKTETGNTGYADPVTEMSNPYSTPEAELSANDNDELAPEKVPAGSSIGWLSRGFWHFKQNPFAWMAAIIVFMILFALISLIPFAGGLITNLISPIIMAGFALGAHEQHEGGDFRVVHLFAGFSNNVGQLMLVGVVYLVAIFAIGLVFALLVGGTMSSSGMLNEGMDPAAMAALMQQPVMIIMMLLIFTVVILVTMAYYYAPVLIALEDLSALSAMAMSFKACLKNWLAFLIYGLLLIVLFIVISSPVLLGAWIIIPLALLVVIPVIQATIYTSYRDIFHHEY